MFMILLLYLCEFFHNSKSFPQGMNGPMRGNGFRYPAGPMPGMDGPNGPRFGGPGPFQKWPPGVFPPNARYPMPPNRPFSGPNGRPGDSGTNERPGDIEDENEVDGLQTFGGPGPYRPGNQFQPQPGFRPNDDDDEDEQRGQSIPVKSQSDEADTKSKYVTNGSPAEVRTENSDYSDRSEEDSMDQTEDTESTAAGRRMQGRSVGTTTKKYDRNVLPFLLDDDDDD